MGAFVKEMVERPGLCFLAWIRRFKDITNHKCDLSVVIISRNEERNIARCIESVLKALERIDSHEVILVDSASTDRTVEIAEKYPIRILQLKPELQLSPAAGRFIGTLHLKKLRNNIGSGQMLRCIWNDKKLLKGFLDEYKFFITHIVYYALGLVVMITYPFFKIISLIYAWVIGLLFLLAINSVKSQNIAQSLLYMFSAVPRGIYFTIGFLKPVRDPNNFPKEVIVIK